jgi:hypothetical protein
MDTTTQSAIDYTHQLQSINDNLVSIHNDLILLNNQFFWFLVVAFVVLTVVICYKILHSFY